MTMLLRNEALYLVKTYNNQSDCFISAKHSYAMIKFVYSIKSRHEILRIK